MDKTGYAQAHGIAGMRGIVTRIFDHQIVADWYPAHIRYSEQSTRL